MLRATVLVALVLPGIVRAQTVRDCRAIPDSLERLTCYDKAVDRGAPAALPGASEDEHVVATFSGIGNQATPRFIISAPWELRWSPPDGGVTVFLKTAAGQLVESYPTGTEARLGQAPQPEGGEFSLDIHSFGPWMAQAVEVAR